MTVMEIGCPVCGHTEPARVVVKHTVDPEWCRTDFLVSQYLEDIYQCPQCTLTLPRSYWDPEFCADWRDVFAKAWNLWKPFEDPLHIGDMLGRSMHAFDALGADPELVSELAMRASWLAFAEGDCEGERYYQRVAYDSLETIVRTKREDDPHDYYLLGELARRIRGSAFLYLKKKGVDGHPDETWKAVSQEWFSRALEFVGENVELKTMILNQMETPSEWGTSCESDPS